MNNNMRKITLGGLVIALAQVLSYVKVYEAPQGGSVTLGSMVPIILFSLIFGVKDGLLVSFTYGILQFLLGGGITIHPASIIMDYLLGFGVLGFAGLITKGQKNLTKAVIGSIFASVLRFLMLILAGATIWKAYAPEGMNPWVYSLGYNAAYMIPEIILTAVIIYFLFPRLYNEFRKAGAF